MDVSEAADRVEIRDLMDRYAVGVDNCDWDLYRSAFTTDAIIDYTEFGGARAGLDATVEWLDIGLRTLTRRHHNLTTHLCEIKGDAARAITYWVFYQTVLDGSGGEFTFEAGGFYRDRLVRQDRWRISERVDLATWMKAPWPEGMTPPAWYGTTTRHEATYLDW